MAQPKVDLNKIKDEIASRRREVTGVPQRLGEATGAYAAPKDEFLNGLIISLKTGQTTPSSKLLKEVDNAAAIRAGEKPRARIPINNNQEPEYYQPPVKKNSEMVFDSPDREEQMYADLNRRKKQTLAEALEDGLIKQPNQLQQPRSYSGQPMAINEQALVENVRGAVNVYLAESLMPILEESTRSVIIEMYAAEKLKTVLHENKEMIKGLILEVFREIQAKQKAK